MSASPSGLHPARVQRAMPLTHVERLGVAGERVHVEQAGHDLVQRVERRPGRAVVAEAVEQLLGERAEVAAAAGALALGEHGDDLVSAEPGLRVAGRGPDQGACREVVTRRSGRAARCPGPPSRRAALRSTEGPR